MSRLDRNRRAIVVFGSDSRRTRARALCLSQKQSAELGMSCDPVEKHWLAVALVVVLVLDDARDTNSAETGSVEG